MLRFRNVNFLSLFSFSRKMVSLGTYILGYCLRIILRKQKEKKERGEKNDRKEQETVSGSRVIKMRENKRRRIF